MKKQENTIGEKTNDNFNAWLSAFTEVAINKIQDLEDSYNEYSEYKSPTNYWMVWRPFSYFQPKDCKVIILGQDPYKNGNIANGLAFDTNNKNLPPSLKNILNKVIIEHDLKGTTTNNFISLEKWAMQGVLLINSSPIITNNKKTNLRIALIWSLILKEIGKSVPNAIVIAMGKEAQKIQKRLFKANKSISTTHPSPLSAYRGFFKEEIFMKANKMLISEGFNPLDWGKCFS